MRAITKVVLAGVLGAIVSVAGLASAASTRGTSISCSWHAQNQGPWQAHGTQRGSVKCSRPLGNGDYRARYRDTFKPTRPLTASQSGSSKLTLERGTVRGTYKLAAAKLRKGNRYRGTFHITGGTGKFRNASGTLQLICTVHVPKQACTVSGPVTGI